MNAAACFEKLKAEAARDPYVLGLFLSGSRGKGFEIAHSDYDIVIVVQDEAPDTVAQAYTRYAEHPQLEVFPRTLAAFRSANALGSDTAWARYDYSHVRAILDKTGEIQDLIDAKGTLPQAQRDAYLRNNLDAYLNAHYRALKRHRAGDGLGAKLEAVCGLPFLLATLFGLEGRHAPYLGYLERELRAYSLEHVSGPRLLELIEDVTEGDPVAQHELFLLLERLCLEAGLDDVYLAWGDAYTFMKAYPTDDGAATVG